MSNMELISFFCNWISNFPVSFIKHFFPQTYVTALSKNSCLEIGGKISLFFAIGVGTIRKCGMFGIDEVLSLRWALRFLKLKSGPVSLSLFLMPANLDGELSATSAPPCLLTPHDDIEPKLWTICQH